METINHIRNVVEKSGQTDAHVFWQIRTDLFKKYIKTSHNFFDGAPATPELEKLQSPHDKRFILSATKTMQSIAKMNENHVFHSECNGLVVEIDTWKPLCIPVPSFQTSVDNSAANLMLRNNEYDIYEIEDGTLINMYFYPTQSEQKWRMSTTHGFDVNDLKWNSDQTYQEIFDDVLEHLNISKNEFYEALNPQKSYSFIFKHPTFHPFFEGKDPIFKLIFVQSADLQTGKYDFYTSPLEKIICQKRIETPIKNMKMIYTKVTKAYDDFISKKTVSYGFILRAKNFDITAPNQQYLIESKLLNTIKKLYYDSAHSQNASQNGISREKYIVLNAFLDRRIYQAFIQLFPQYLTKFKEYRKLSEMIIAHIVNPISIPTSASDNYRAIISKFITNIGKMYTITTTNNCMKNIISYVVDPTNLMQFVSIADSV